MHWLVEYKGKVPCFGDVLATLLLRKDMITWIVCLVHCQYIILVLSVSGGMGKKVIQYNARNVAKCGDVECSSGRAI